MSDSQHTPGCIRYDYEPGYCGEFLFQNGTMLCSFFDEPRKEDARRLVACWNLLEGVPTEKIEQSSDYGSSWGKCGLELAAITAQRDELVAALRKAVEWNEEVMPTPDWVYEARAAISKAEGDAA